MSLFLLALALGSGQQNFTSKTCPGGAIVLEGETCPARVIQNGRCALRGEAAPALPRVWRFRMEHRVLTAGPETDANEYLGSMSEAGHGVLKGVLYGKGAKSRVLFALSTETRAIDGRQAYLAAVVPLDAAEKPTQQPASYICEISVTSS